MIGQRIYSGSAFEEKAGYARAVVDGEWVLVSGTTGFDPETKQLADGVEAQCENCFRNIERALIEAGSDMFSLLRLRIYVASREEFQRIVPIIQKHSMASRPTNTTVICEMVDEKMRVEIEATAKLRTSAARQGRA